MNVETGSPPNGTIAADVADPQPTAPGAEAASPLAMPRKAWVQILKRMWTMWGFHNLSLLGAGVAFFTFLAITPLIAATVMIYGLLGDVQMVQRQMAMIVEVVPSDAARLIQDQMVQAVTANAGVTGMALIVALSFAIYGGMRAASGLIGALNIINEEHETRGIVALTLRQTALTVAAILIALTGLISAGVFAWLQFQAGNLLGPEVEFLFNGPTGDLVRKAYVEVGDFAAGKAFVSMAKR
ncbi:MAG: YihY/virulence factor BrkB family protein [Oxalobacteraceae bacterium]|nr:MAG: YihY/virulence factor BrkB family protein [Oxalobacteraceae bacterium]